MAVILKLANQPLAYYQTNVLEDDLRQSLQELRSNLSNSPTNTEEVRTEATKVYDWLIKPLETELDKNQQIDTLVFVLDRPLQSVPMAVLYDQKSDQYLVEKKYALALASGLKLIEPSPWEQVKTDSIKAFVGGVGIPQEFDNFKFEEIKLLEEELEAVSNNVPTNKPLLNEEFTQIRLQNQLASDRYSIIHIKTHGVFSSNPEQTFILAYKKTINSQELGKLVKLLVKIKKNLLSY
ncbi:CHAT domain-containing protein [Oscillatoria laete-virens NRMC-F 0139]|nr:CHAT domain-containing protein [Oscillatoria laete-virens]MDL5052076.1 CHAT domain-containing protein [Oscillatoria laete-virens NRMC-F 0139]